MEEAASAVGRWEKRPLLRERKALQVKSGMKATTWAALLSSSLSTQCKERGPGAFSAYVSNGSFLWEN